MLIPTLLAACLGQGPASFLTANVDDPLSHGTVGDQRLSLDEAIRLANGTLSMAQLSAQEQARVTGTGTVVDRIVVDAMVVPTITVQQALTGVTGPFAMAPRITIEGMPAGSAMPVLQGGAASHVIALRTHTVTVMGLRIVGGQVGIDSQIAFTGLPMTEMALVERCELEGQTVAGCRLRGTNNDESMLMVMRTSLKNMPAGFLVDDQTAGGSMMGEAEFITFDGVTTGCDVVENGMGQLTMFMLFRSTFTNGTTFTRVRRAAPSTQQLMVRFTFCDALCTGDVVDVQGNTAGLTIVHHHHSDFFAGATHKAFWTWPRTAEFDVHGSEMKFRGDVLVSANPFTMRVWQQNNQYENGTVTYDVDGALPNLLWNRYVNCSFVVPSTARSPVALRSCELINTPVSALSLFAPVLLQGCYRSGGTLTGQVTETSPAPQRFLGTTTVSPTEPQIGTSVRVSADLPFGIGAMWDFALASYPRPTTTIEPVRFYGDPATVIVMPGFVVFQSYIDVPLPFNTALVGMELYVQAVAIPLLGQTYAPVYHLPRGGLVRPRL